MKKLVAIIMMAIVLVGCGSKEVTTVGKGDMNGMTYEVELVSKGDNVSKQKEVVAMDLKKLGLTEEQAKASMEPLAKTYDKLEGVTFNIKTDSDKVILSSEIDYDKAKIDELEKVGLLAENDGKYVSLKKTKEQYETQYKVVFEEK